MVRRVIADLSELLELASFPDSIGLIEYLFNGTVFALVYKPTMYVFYYQVLQTLLSYE